MHLDSRIHRLDIPGGESIPQGSILNRRGFVDTMWRATPATFAYHVSRGTWKPARHLNLISLAIARAVYGTGPRYIIVSIPPRHGKSELISKWTPTWALENFQQKRIICATHTASLAQEWGKSVRNLIAESPDLTVSLRKDSKKADQWATTKGGGMKTTGVGSAILGWGADILIIDDPHSGWEEITSAAHRKRVWEWWQSDALSRLHPGACVIVLMQRLHHEDLAGKLLAMSASNPAAMQFHEIRFPMICEDHDDVLGRKPGEVLWPEMYDIAKARELEASKDSVSWLAQYQQKPMKDGGFDRVYHAFKPENVWNTSLEWNPNQPIYWSVDFNIDPMCSVIMQEEPKSLMFSDRHKQSRLFVLDEIRLANATTLDACAEFESRMRPLVRARGRVRVKIMGDAAGHSRDTAAKSASTTDYTLMREFFRSRPGFDVTFDVPRSNPSRRDRYNAVNALLCSASGVRRLFIDPRCKGLIRDLKEVSFTRDINGNVTNMLDKSDPSLTHVSDAAGYAIERLFGLRGGGSQGDDLLQ